MIQASVCPWPDKLNATINRQFRRGDPTAAAEMTVFLFCLALWLFTGLTKKNCWYPGLPSWSHSTVQLHRSRWFWEEEGEGSCATTRKHRSDVWYFGVFYVSMHPFLVFLCSFSCLFIPQHQNTKATLWCFGVDNQSQFEMHLFLVFWCSISVYPGTKTPKWCIGVLVLTIICSFG